MTLPQLLISHLNQPQLSRQPGPGSPRHDENVHDRHDETTSSIPNLSKPNHLQLAGRRLTTLNGFCIHLCLHLTSHSPAESNGHDIKPNHPSIQPHLGETQVVSPSSDLNLQTSNCIRIDLSLQTRCASL